VTSLNAPKSSRRESVVTVFLNRYATPLTTGLFLISTISGVALFFRWQPRAFHAMHEWLSLLLLAPIIFHLWKNWRPLTSYAKRGWLLIPLVLSIAAAVPFAWSGLTSTGGGNPAFRIIPVIAKARLTDLAPILRTTPEALLASLREKGYAVASTDQTLDAVATAAGVPPSEILLKLIPAR
jgi:hypothetical protein